LLVNDAFFRVRIESGSQIVAVRTLYNEESFYCGSLYKAIYIYTAFGLMGNFKHDLLAGK